MRFSFFLPELYWLFIAIVILLLGVTLTESEHKIVFKHFGNLLIYTLSLYGYIYIQSPLVSYSLLNYQYTSDSFLSMIKLLIIFFLIFLVYVSSHYFFIERVFFFEYYFLVSIFCISLFFLISANDLILFYLIIELQALILYTLASIKKYNVFSAEAGLKYFVLGAFSSGLLLFGISFFYGFTGLTNFYDLKYLMLNMSESFVYIGLNLSVTFLLTAFLFKLAAAPFHLWVPDVYSGAPTAVVALFATLPKLAIFIFLIRFYTAIIADVGDLVYKFLFFLALFL